LKATGNAPVPLLTPNEILIVAMNCRSSRIRFILGVLAVVASFAVARPACADVFEWEYINPANPSQGTRPSTRLVVDGNGIFPTAGVYLSGLNLTKGYLVGADLGPIFVDGGEIGQSFIIPANLASTNFSQADLTNANLNNAWLPSANFSQANLYNANLTSVVVLMFAARSSLRRGFPLPRSIPPPATRPAT
jgi:hypothetical protein